MARVCVFIDGANFYHSCKANMGGRTDINMGSFASFLVGPSRELVRTYYYGCALPPDHDEDSRKAQQRFFTALQRIPYTELRLGRMVKRDVECPSCHDTHRAIRRRASTCESVSTCSQARSKQLYDVAVLVSGDGDLVEAVRAVKDSVSTSRWRPSAKAVPTNSPRPLMSLPS